MGLLLCFFHRNFIIIVGLLLSAADCRRRRVKLNWKRVAVWHRDRLLPVRRLDKIVRLKKPASEPLRLSKQHSSNDINTHTHTHSYIIYVPVIYGISADTLAYSDTDTKIQIQRQAAKLPSVLVNDSNRTRPTAYWIYATGASTSECLERRRGRGRGRARGRGRGSGPGTWSSR